MPPPCLYFGEISPQEGNLGAEMGNLIKYQLKEGSRGGKESSLAHWESLRTISVLYK